MPDDEYPLWSGLDSRQRVEAVMAIIQAAAVDPAFRTACLNEQTRQTTMEKKARVKFDQGMTLKCFPTKTAKENELTLVLPGALPNADEEKIIKENWICTYVDYKPKSPTINPAPDSPALGGDAS